MDIRKIQSVCAVDTQKNYTEAAYQLSSSPSVISKHVAAIEEELGVTLFNRASRTTGVEVTAVGRVIIDQFHDICKIYEQIISDANASNNYFKNLLSIGFIPTIGSYHETDLFTDFLSKYSEITLRRYVGNDRRLIELLTGGRADGIILPVYEGSDSVDSIFAKLNTDNIAIIEIFSTSEVHLGLPKNHPLASLPIIPRSRFNELQNETFLLSSQYLLDNGRRKELQRMFGFENQINVKYLDFVEPELALRYVGKGLGLLPLSTFVPKEIEDVVFVPLECKNPTPVSLYYVYKKTNASRALKLFTKYIEEEASKIYSAHK